MRIRDWGRDFHFPLHRYLWCNLAHNAMALPHGYFPTECSSKRRCMVRGWLVYRQWNCDNDYTFPFPSHQLWYPTIALWSQHLLPAIRHSDVPRDIWTKLGADGRLFRKWRQLECLQGQPKYERGRYRRLEVD